MHLLFSIGSKILFPESSTVHGTAKYGRVAELDVTVESSTNQIHEKWLVGICEGTEKLKDKQFSELGQERWAAIAVKIDGSTEGSMQQTSGKCS